MIINFNLLEYICRIKWGLSRQEYLSMTMREINAFQQIENPPEVLAFAEDIL
jgi:hypothetical protein